VRDTRYEWAYIFGAVCPERATGAALVLPFANTEAMNLHLAEISRTVAPGAHAVLVLDGAGWHGGKDLAVPDTISLLTLPPYAPELNPVENVWEYLRGNRRLGDPPARPSAAAAGLRSVRSRASRAARDRRTEVMPKLSDATANRVICTAAPKHQFQRSPTQAFPGCRARNAGRRLTNQVRHGLVGARPLHDGV
jgi:transposase